MNIPLFSWALLAVFAFGLYLVTRQLLDVVFDLAAGTVEYLRYRMQPKLVRLLESRSDTTFQAFIRSGDDEKNERTFIVVSLLYLRVMWVAGALLATFLMYDELRSPIVFAVILVAGELYRSRVDYQRTSKLNDDVGNLVVQFVARYPIAHSAKKTLQDTAAILPKGRVKKAILLCLNRLDAGQPPSEALIPLSEVQHPVLRRFASIVMIAQDTDRTVLLDTLKLLSDDVESRLDLRRQSRRSLTLVRGTVRVLQVVIVVAMGVVGVLPAWRSYFLTNSKNWLLLVSMVIVSALSSFYVEAEMRQLEV